ncbi:MAG: radical SAM family heme chaperone HemW [Gammaproteobacteria bacterium]|nr:radical SAM family heme chaperone HemW [Gammaproteobacteria bacterium]MDH4314393.1 radical SAM family heme chaperone HemW [Gammaproteobacteria bacterium]MDH5213177.1 radical SAM family heme chaperone HemW [Gammaproteobacteria bacterium]MDH5499755.1 radical SAM family heme chaperone HemW [Gammaproteobacteria bacterium]
MPNRELPPLSLYLHMPWCVRKCPYCDFNSHTAGPAAPKDRYVDALLLDLEAEAASGRAAGRAVDSIFIGGGTPSLFSATQIGRVLDAARAVFAIGAGAEITMEANPGTVECGDLPGYRQAGVNRLSIGAQSFDAGTLLALGRIHGPAEIVRTYNAARAAGFDAINLDLMFALPGQGADLARADIEQAIQLGAPHISYYQLTLEPNTVFHSRPPPGLPDDETSWEIQQLGHGLLQAAGYEQYEISAFAKPGQRCRHNLNYWKFGDYLGVGAGAHGKFTSADGRIWRYAKPANPQGYMQQAERRQFAAAAQAVSESELCFEFMLNVLRLPEGFSTDEFRRQTGLPLSAVEAGLGRAISKGLIVSADGRDWKPTPLGWRFLNDLQAEFLPD